ncbi:MATE efflux family protein [Actinidia rufa]|uniref:MATE efflux family protein n=1 Tax=Actinidia rufa TaxID=165716 RepID=A0A7J0FHB0_9ERIC|nr:MATE efflux family protein [Actinidia rufa]
MEGDINEKLLTGVNGDKGVAKEEKFKDKLWAENKKMWIVAAPAIFTRFSTFGINVISQAFIGHIGPTELAAYSLVSTVILRFSNGILLGMASALETLCGQAYGANQYHMLGVYLQRSWLVLFISAIFLLPLFIFTTPILKALGQDEAIAQVAGTIILILLTGNMTNAEVAIDALAICVRVSNELGRGSSKDAKFSVVNIVLTSLAIGFVLFIFFLFFRGRLAYIFTESREVAAAVADLSPLLAISILLNSVQPVLSGVAVWGWLAEHCVAYVNIACYYLVGIPVGVVLGYIINFQVKVSYLCFSPQLSPHLSAQCVWIGMLFGTFVQTIVLLIITYRTDWDKQVSMTRNRINKWFVEPEQPIADQQGA